MTKRIESVWVVVEKSGRKCIAQNVANFKLLPSRMEDLAVGTKIALKGFSLLGQNSTGFFHIEHIINQYFYVQHRLVAKPSFSVINLLFLIYIRLF
jgi:hypothetical protein